MTRNLQVLVDSPPAKRSCGTCSLCCTVMGVEELKKPRDHRCEFLNVLGRCSCYATRPQSCADFECLWLQGLWPEKLRPDRSRAVPSTNAAGDMFVLHIAPQDRGAHLRGKLADTIARAASGGIPVIVVCGDERTIFGARPEDIRVLAKNVSADGSVTTQELKEAL